MSVAENIHPHDGGVTFTGEEGTTFFGIMSLRKGMAIEVRTGLKFFQDPWPQARELLGLSGSKEEMLAELDQMIAEGKTQKLVDRVIARRKAEEEVKNAEPKEMPGTGDPERVVHEVGGIFPVTVERVCELLDMAYGSTTYGSGSWMARCGDRHVQPSDESMIPSTWKDYPASSWCFGDGKVILCDVEEYLEYDRDDERATKWELTEEKIKVGIEIMGKKYKDHFVDAFIDDNADAITGDVFLQCCVFGEIVYV